MTANQAGEKRKSKSSSLFSRKKTKTVHLTADDLPWKTVSRPREADLGDGFDGLLELEEVENVEVVYEKTDAGKVVKFKVSGNAVKSQSEEEQVNGEESEQELGQTSLSTSQTSEIPDISQEEPLFDSRALLPEWRDFSLHQQLFRALYLQHFLTPTPIQAQTLPVALQRKDVVGVAETGSGKTLAYGLPILHYLLTNASTSAGASDMISKSRRNVRALVLAPTRELALQVSSHLNACLNYADTIPAEAIEGENVKKAGDKVVSKESRAKKGKGKEKVQDPETGTHTKAKPPPLVSVAAVIGGMSAQKQKRILSRGVDVLVATPGRLWDILQEDNNLANDMGKLRFLVLDEADRMIETGHFAEMENILRLTLRQDKEDEIETQPELDDEEEDSKEGVKDGELQTFVFSATLSKDLQRNLKRRLRPGRRKNDKPASTLDDLLMRLDFRDPEPAIIDLSPAGGVVATLRESKIECLTSDKDVYLYYFLLRYPGRTLVFLSSIDGIRRLLPLMDLLQFSAFPLHSQLEQRQRLKNLDRFKSTPQAVLLATDVAARGLDIPAVDHVVHYQVPRTADAYVHRNGRTARAMRRGFSLLICAPDERRIVKALMGSLNRQEEEIPEMPVELYLLDKLKARVQLARQIDITQHKVKKEKHERNWLKEAAEAMELELDSDLASASEDELGTAPSKHKPRGVSTRYITSGSVSIADDLLAGEYHESIVGLKKAEAGSDLVPAKQRRPKVKEDFEEWRGFGS
ncbi:hypothetical protein AcW1_009535 [Taiwanofungus camphoratus]|nr:hypothetical protein AcV7_002669 [Antrodia cinnamomea]KAI0947892.1 hypothetical protein AcW1_009535 [Antrodia cinnamomea]